MIKFLLFNLITKAYAEAPPQLKIAPNKATTDGYTTDKLSLEGGGLKAIGGKVIDILLIGAGIVAIIFVIWYGIQYITSGGDADKATKARTGIVNAIIGVAVIAAAYAIIQFGSNLGGSVSGLISATPKP